jgi:hypothetical protein
MNDFQQMIEPAHDVIALPSGGLFYKNKKAAVKVAYLTASDENLLTSPNLIQSGKVLDMLLDKKVLDKDLRPKDMLACDRNAILFWLRATGYGEMYSVELVDPKTKENFETEVDISTFQAKDISVEPDQNGEITFQLPKTKKVIKYRYLTSDEEDVIAKEDEAKRKKMGVNAVSELLTKRLQAQVMEIDGIRDKQQIIEFVNNMMPIEASQLRKFIVDNEPGLDTRINVEAPSGEFFFGELPITTKFLWPYLNV